ncbi:TIGR03620 family F420-dependent LLM class oxidoreductase [Mycolicibacterium sp. XJ1819]
MSELDVRPILARLGRVGIWTRQLDAAPARRAGQLAGEIEALGYSALWIPEAIEREVMTHASMLLAATSRLTVGTGVAITPARDARAAALAQRLLAEQFPQRFLLGLGVSHPAVVTVLRRGDGRYGDPIEVMGAYLDDIDDVLNTGHPTTPAHRPPRILAALGPRMTALARDRADGAHSYLAPVSHTAWARQTLGADKMLVVCVRAVLHNDVRHAQAVARESLLKPTRNPAYRNNLARAGFAGDDFDPTASERLVDALVAYPDVETVAGRVTEHLNAGADHVCVEFLTGDDVNVPLDQWRSFAAHRPV